MLPFWNFLSNENAFKIEDHDNNIKIEVHEKKISGKNGNISFQRFSRNISVNGFENNFLKVLENFNPIKFFGSFISNTSKKQVEDNNK